jgi:hypothetical protein
MSATGNANDTVRFPVFVLTVINIVSVASDQHTIIAGNAIDALTGLAVIMIDAITFANHAEGK